MPRPLVTLTTALFGPTIFPLAGFVNAVYAKKFGRGATRVQRAFHTPPCEEAPTLTQIEEAH